MQDAFPIKDDTKFIMQMFLLRQCHDLCQSGYKNAKHTTSTVARLIPKLIKEDAENLVESMKSIVLKELISPACNAYINITEFYRIIMDCEPEVRLVKEFKEAKEIMVKTRDVCMKTVIILEKFIE